MTNAKEIIEYLSEFPDDSQISVLAVNPGEKAREIYPVMEIGMVEKDKHTQSPFFVVVVGDPEPLDIFAEGKNGQIKFVI